MKMILRSALTFALIGMAALSCRDEFLEQPPIGTFDEGVLNNAIGVEGRLIAAYSLLNGVGASGGGWEASGTNWVFGSIVGGDAYKGTDAGDQANINSIERHEALPNNGYFINKWRVLYDGIARSNDVIVSLDNAEGLSDAAKTRILAEARFLRGHFHFEAKKMWNRIPFIDDEVERAAKSDYNAYKVPNTGEGTEIWSRIEADFKFAYDNLSGTMPDIGRANKWAAGAYLAKAMLFQNKFSQALPILNDVYNNGTTAGGQRYRLNDLYHDNFRIATNNSAEGVFEIQYSVNDGSVGANGGAGEVLNYPYNAGPGGCCGFFQPSQSLVNSFRVDANGLPFLDTFNSQDVPSDQGIASSAPFTPPTIPLDARLDWTVGRRGLPYLDWGDHPGQNWIRDQNYGGPYAPKKNVYYQAEEGSLTEQGGWTRGYSSNNFRLIRFADVILMLAEAEAEAGSTERARQLVNEVRQRAANPQGFVRRANGDAAANYRVGLYTAPWGDKNLALKAIRFERKIEMGMEGVRFFDLVRWGIAAEELNAYLTIESTRRFQYTGARFTAGKSEYYPIPEQVIINSQIDGVPTIQQNPGY